MIFNGKLSEPALIVIGIVAGYICAVILQSIIKRLKKVENFAAEKSEILLSRGTVSNDIQNIRQEINDIKGDFATTFVLREDFFRSMNGVEDRMKIIDNKLDKLLLMGKENK